MTPTQRRALEIISKRDGLRASGIGWELWGKTTAVPKRGEGSHGTNKFCRAAGKILNQLNKLDYVEWGTDGHGITWHLTFTGEQALKETA